MIESKTFMVLSETKVAHACAKMIMQFGFRVTEKLGIRHCL